MAKKGFKGFISADEKMKGSKNQPLRNEPGRIQQVSRNPKGIRLAVVVLVGGRDAWFWSK
jgi:hypothetical protein